jgi:hypothetical protein
VKAFIQPSISETLYPRNSNLLYACEACPWELEKDVKGNDSKTYFSLLLEYIYLMAFPISSSEKV